MSGSVCGSVCEDLEFTDTASLSAPGGLGV